jgi:nucleotide-binding universal stress UspA family protein
MARRVLVTLDGSRLSEAIIPFLPAILRPNDEVMLFTVGAPPHAVRRPRAGASQPIVVGTAFARLEPAPPQYAEDMDHAIQRAKSELLDYLQDAALFLRNEGLTVTCHVELGEDAAKEIIEFARREGPLLIAMATHGRSGLSHAVNGSVAEAVVRSKVAPVLLIRP